MSLFTIEYDYKHAVTRLKVLGITLLAKHRFVAGGGATTFSLIAS